MAASESDPNVNTHEMPYGFNPFSSTVFSIQTDQEWDTSHYTFTTPDGLRYRVPKDAIRIVCPRPDDVPMQPPIGYGVLFEDGTEWVRSSDGFWHEWSADKIEDYDMAASAQDWEALWAAHGTAHWRALCPLRPEQIPWIMDREGPIGHLVMPHMDEEGDPTPGHVAWLEADSPDMHIREVLTNTEIVIPGNHFVTAAEMFVRTLWRRNGAAKEDVMVPDDASALDETSKE